LHAYETTQTTIKFTASTNEIEDETNGDYITGGIEDTSVVRVSGSASNDGIYSLSSVSETVLITNEALVNEAAGNSVTIRVENEDSILIGIVTLIRAPKTMHGHRFPRRYQQRAFWGGDIYGNEENALDYSAANTIDVYNGFDSSDRGKRIYVGGPERLTGSAVVFNRFGSGIFETMLIFKESETHLLFGTSPADFKLYEISHNYGCPAPLTIASAEMGYELAAGSYRNIAMWLSYRGPVIFDGAVITPVAGIDRYFDTRRTEYINTTYLKDAVGWFDPYWMEYHLLLPSGSTATVMNTHVVYDLVRKKWYEVNYDGGSSDFPQYGFMVKDENGVNYPYVIRDDGFMLRFANGTDWDGNAITHSVKTADFVPSGSIWYGTKMIHLKIAHEIPDFDNSNQSITVSTNYYVDGGTVAVALDDWEINKEDNTEELILLEEDGNELQEEGGDFITYLSARVRRYNIVNQGMNKAGLSHQFEFSRTSTWQSYTGDFVKRLLW
jgi:hypothetical protein